MKAKPIEYPMNVEGYRATTERHAVFAGVTSPSFICQRCGQHRTTNGRKRAVKGTTKFGYVCRECAGVGA